MRRTSTLAPLVLMAWLVALVAAFAAGCASNAQSRVPTIDALPSATASPESVVLGGKPVAPADPIPTATPAAVEPIVDPEQSAAAAEPTTPAPAPPRTADGSLPPDSGRWIDVDVTNFVVRLMDGATVVRELAPVAVGTQVDTGEYASTQTGTFHIGNKVEGLAYDEPYKTYISHWVGFDPDRANGFHSFLKDKDGNVVDASTGRVSNGCIRTAEPDVVFAFAEIGMAVYLHW